MNKLCEPIKSYDSPEKFAGTQFGSTIHATSIYTLVNTRGFFLIKWFERPLQELSL